MTEASGDLVGLGKVAEAAERSTREIRELLLRFLGPSADEGGEWLAEEIRALRARRIVARMARAAEILEERNVQALPVPLHFFGAFYEGASFTSDEFLQEAWSGLLVAAAVQGGERIAYARILSELEPLDARLLHTLCSGGTITKPAGTAEFYRWPKAPAASTQEIFIAVQNLKRLRLVEEKEWPSGEGDLFASAFGRDFWWACQGRGAVRQ